MLIFDNAFGHFIGDIKESLSGSKHILRKYFASNRKGLLQLIEKGITKCFKRQQRRSFY